MTDFFLLHLYKMSLFELLLTFNSSTQEAEENLPAKTTQWAPHLQSPSLACLRCYEMTLSLIHTSLFMKPPKAPLFGWYLSFLNSMGCHLRLLCDWPGLHVQPATPATGHSVDTSAFFLVLSSSATLSCFMLTFSVDHFNSVLLSSYFSYFLVRDRYHCVIPDHNSWSS